MTWIKGKHDLGILRQDGSTTVGFMLLRTKENAPSWSEAVDEYLAQQQTQVAGYSGLPYEKEIKIIQDDWRAGYGLEYFDSTDPLRYNSAYNMDLRHRGMAICSNVPTTAALTTALSWSNTDFEDWSGGNPNNWTEVDTTGDITVQEETTIVNNGSSSLEFDDGNSTAAGYVYQDAANWNNIYRGTVVIVKIYAWCDTGSIARIALSDEDGTTYSSYHSGGSGWELLSVTRTLGANATRCRIQCHHESAALQQWTRFDGVMTLPAQGAVRFFKGGTFNDDEYFSAGTYLFKVDNATGTITPEGLFAATITSLAAFTDDKLYIAQGASENYWYMTTAEAFTQSDSKAYHFTVVGTTMWKSLLPRSIYSATNPISDANWSGATTVDTSANNITDMISFDNALYIMKEDRPFYLDSGGAVNTLTNITAPMSASTSGKGVIEWQASLYMPWGDQGLLEYESVEGTFTWRDPASFATRLGDFDGRVQALGADEQYLYAIVDNAAKIEVMAGRLETISGSTMWVWHPLNEITLTGCETAKVSAVFQRRLWISSTNSSDSLYYIALPAGYGYIEADANRNFGTNGYFITTRYHGEFKGDTKAFIKATAVLGHAHDTLIYFECHFKKLEDAAWTDAGDFKGTSSNRVATLFLTAPTSSTSLQYKIVAKTDDTTKTPILLSLETQALLYPTRRKVITCIIRVGEDIRDLQGQVLEDGLTEQKATLDELVTDPTWPFAIYDLDGTTRYMKLLSIDPFKQPIFNEKDRPIEWRYALKMQEVALS